MLMFPAVNFQLSTWHFCTAVHFLVVAAKHSLLFSSIRHFLRFDLVCLGLIAENNCTHEHAV